MNIFPPWEPKYINICSVSNEKICITILMSGLSQARIRDLSELIIAANKPRDHKTTSRDRKPLKIHKFSSSI